MSAVLAWWFSAGDTLPNGDGRKIVVGETLTVECPLVLCQHGLHGSLRCFDAIRYAKGPWLHRTRHDGETLHGDDKLCSTRRTVLARIDATDMLRLFARQCASDVLLGWDAPAVVREYLTTGDETIRIAARDDATGVFLNATSIKIKDFAWTAALAAAQSPAWRIAWDTAKEAAWAAAWGPGEVVADDPDSISDAVMATQSARLEAMALAAIGDGP